MARTVMTARKSTGGLAPRRQLATRAARGYTGPITTIFGDDEDDEVIDESTDNDWGLNTSPFGAAGGEVGGQNTTLNEASDEVGLYQIIPFTTPLIASPSIASPPPLPTPATTNKFTRVLILGLFPTPSFCEIGVGGRGFDSWGSVLDSIAMRFHFVAGIAEKLSTASLSTISIDEAHQVQIGAKDLSTVTKTIVNMFTKPVINDGVILVAIRGESSTEAQFTTGKRKASEYDGGDEQGKTYCQIKINIINN